MDKKKKIITKNSSQSLLGNCMIHLCYCRFIHFERIMILFISICVCFSFLFSSLLFKSGNGFTDHYVVLASIYFAFIFMSLMSSFQSFSPA